MKHSIHITLANCPAVCAITKTVCIAFVFCAVTAIPSPAQTFTTLVSFNAINGANPEAGVVQGTDGNFYGTTERGGGNSSSSCVAGCGTVFKVTPAGTLTTLHSFVGYPSDGAYPHAGLIQGTDGNFYGTTFTGGVKGNYGTIYKIAPTGTLTMLYSFCAQTGCLDGANPEAGLVQATDGNFYGTTFQGGGSNNCFNGCGTVFKITTAGALTTLHSFCSQGTVCTDGAIAYAGLVQGNDGSFYGTTGAGGANQNCSCGTVFKLSSGATARKRLVQVTGE